MTQEDPRSPDAPSMLANIFHLAMQAQKQRREPFDRPALFRTIRA